MSIAIKAEGLSKAYQLGDFGTGTISRDIERFWLRLIGREDSFLKIGEVNDRTARGLSDMVWSLNKLDFEVRKGDAVGIIGRNGAGKSTLLKILSRVTAPTTGSVRIKGRIASLLEVGTGFHPELTGRENIYLNGAILGMRKAEIKRKFDEIVAFAGVERYIDTPVKRYSSGMYVRLAFAVAAHLESDILIVDEVLAVGDAEFQKKCLGKMGEVSKGEGRTVLFVSHNMDAVKTLCNTGMLLDKGSVSLQGNIYDCCEKYLSLDTRADSKNHRIEDIILNEQVRLDLFAFDQENYSTAEPQKINLRISAVKPNKISGLAVLIYNAFDVRVAILDLRVIDPELLSNEHQILTAVITLNNLPLLPGAYKIGLYIDSVLCSDNFLNLLNIGIMSSGGGQFVPYPSNTLGYLDPLFSGNIIYDALS